MKGNGFGHLEALNVIGGGGKGVPSLDMEGVGPTTRNGLDEGDGDGKEGKGVE